MIDATWVANITRGIKARVDGTGFLQRFQQVVAG
jgi:hypothetical protein